MNFFEFGCQEVESERPASPLQLFKKFNFTPKISWSLWLFLFLPSTELKFSIILLAGWQKYI